MPSKLSLYASAAFISIAILTGAYATPIEEGIPARQEPIAAIQKLPLGRPLDITIGSNADMRKVGEVLGEDDKQREVLIAELATMLPAQHGNQVALIETFHDPMRGIAAAVELLEGLEDHHDVLLPVLTGLRNFNEKVGGALFVHIVGSPTIRDVSLKAFHTFHPPTENEVDLGVYKSALALLLSPRTEGPTGPVDQDFLVRHAKGLFDVFKANPNFTPDQQMWKRPLAEMVHEKVLSRLGDQTRRLLDLILRLLPRGDIRNVIMKDFIRNAADPTPEIPENSPLIKAAQHVPEGMTMLINHRSKDTTVHPNILWQATGQAEPHLQDVMRLTLLEGLLGRTPAVTTLPHDCRWDIFGIQDRPKAQNAIPLILKTTSLDSSLRINAAHIQWKRDQQEMKALAAESQRVEAMHWVKDVETRNGLILDILKSEDERPAGASPLWQLARMTTGDAAKEADAIMWKKAQAALEFKQIEEGFYAFLGLQKEPGEMKDKLKAHLKTLEAIHKNHPLFKALSHVVIHYSCLPNAISTLLQTIELKDQNLHPDIAYVIMDPKARKVVLKARMSCTVRGYSFATRLEFARRFSDPEEGVAELLNGISFVKMHELVKDDKTFIPLNDAIRHSVARGPSGGPSIKKATTNFLLAQLRAYEDLARENSNLEDPWWAPDHMVRFYQGTFDHATISPELARFAMTRGTSWKARLLAQRMLGDEASAYDPQLVYILQEKNPDGTPDSAPGWLSLESAKGLFQSPCRPSGGPQGPLRANSGFCHDPEPQTGKLYKVRRGCSRSWGRQPSTSWSS